MKKEFFDEFAKLTERAKTEGQITDPENDAVIAIVTHKCPNGADHAHSMVGLAGSTHSLVKALALAMNEDEDLAEIVKAAYKINKKANKKVEEYAGPITDILSSLKQEMPEERKRRPYESFGDYKARMLKLDKEKGVDRKPRPGENFDQYFARMLKQN